MLFFCSSDIYLQTSVHTRTHLCSYLCEDIYGHITLPSALPNGNLTLTFYHESINPQTALWRGVGKWKISTSSLCPHSTVLKLKLILIKMVVHMSVYTHKIKKRERGIGGKKIKMKNKKLTTKLSSFGLCVWCVWCVWCVLCWRVTCVCTIERQAQPGGAKMPLKLRQGLNRVTKRETWVCLCWCTVYMFVYVCVNQPLASF